MHETFNGFNTFFVKPYGYRLVTGRILHDTQFTRTYSYAIV